MWVRSTTARSFRARGVTTLDAPRAPLLYPSSGRGGGAFRQLPIRPGKVAGIAVRILLQVILVLRLRLPEWPGGRDIRHYFAWPQTRFVHIGDRVLGRRALLFTGIEDR